MLSFSLAFLCGVLSLQTVSTLPSITWAYTIFIVIPIGWQSVRLPKRLYMLAAFLLGFAWSLWYAHHLATWSLPHALEGQAVVVEGTIATIPRQQIHQTSFLFTALSSPQAPSIHGLLQLNWRSCPYHLTVGDRWRLTAKLKRIHGVANPGSFNYEAWAFQQGIRATGYVMPQNSNLLLGRSLYSHPIDRLRQAWKERVEMVLPSTPTAAWIMALVVGERNNIAQDQWAVLRNTGTNHLMAIAGLHIGLMSGWAYAIVMWLWRRTSRCLLIMPAMQAGALAALTMAVFYSAMAGFSIPTQRALIMMFTLMITILLRRKIVSWHAWSLALIVVLLINPLSVLTESFWLSFGTIALIVYGVSSRLAPTGWWWKWGRTQWVIGVGLIPVSLVLFGQCSLASFIANSIAIPWLGLLILPFCFLGSLLVWVSPLLAKAVLWVAGQSLNLLWQILRCFSHWSFAVWHQAVPPDWMIIAALIGVLLLLLPRGFPGRYLGVLWLLPYVLYQPAVPAKGEVRLTLLDVGQGLSAVVQTQRHVLIYDAGPRMGSVDAGESIVVPFLHASGIKQVNMLVVSHGDNDHSGGAGAILQPFPVRYLRSSVPAMFPYANSAYCLRGVSWRWDGVLFTFLHPTRDGLTLGNDSSCVLAVTVGSHRILLPGDIEKLAEKNLLETTRTELAADIIIAPHHGSKTSAWPLFVTTVAPQYVLYATGYRNRYHFPHASVIQAYQRLGVRQLNTMEAGAIQFDIKQQQELLPPILYRERHKRYYASFG